MTATEAQVAAAKRALADVEEVLSDGYWYYLPGKTQREQDTHFESVARKIAEAVLHA